MSGGGGELDAARLGALLATSPLAFELHVHRTVDSTNDEVRRLARNGAPEGTVVVADAQSAGRGRLGRSWASPPALGLYASVLLRPRGPVDQVTRWTLGAAVAACEACRALCGCPVEIKWPNDLLHGPRKLGGILAELRPGASTPELVIGVGINVGHGPEELPSGLGRPVTSLRLAAGRAAPDRERLAALYLAGLAEVHELLNNGNWPAVAGRWERLAPSASGTAVRVEPAGGGPAEERFSGTTRGIDPTGALLVQRADGRTVSVRAVDSVVPQEA